MTWATGESMLEEGSRRSFERTRTSADLSLPVPVQPLGCHNQPDLPQSVPAQQLCCCQQADLLSLPFLCRTTPSYVAFTDTERLIGDAAKNQVQCAWTNFLATCLCGGFACEPSLHAPCRLL